MLSTGPEHVNGSNWNLTYCIICASNLACKSPNQQLWQFWSFVVSALREKPRRGGRQQPHHSLKKFRKYKGGKKSHTMLAQSSPKIPKWHHSALKAWSILAWILGSWVDRRELMAFQVAIPTSTVATQACWRIFLEEYWLSICFWHLFDQRK